VQGTVPASSFSCFPRRQERRLRNESSVCVRPGHDLSARVFRKTCFSKKRAHLSGNTRLRENPRTTTLGPFGEVIRSTGPAAKLNPIRFSSKFDDDESDLLYYGYRYYNPSTGRWLSKDPMGESGFELISNRPKSNAEQQLARRQSGLQHLQQANPRLRILGNGFQQHTWPMSIGGDMITQTGNLYAFVRNDPLNAMDALGLMTITDPKGPVTITPCPKCPFCLAHWLGASNSGVYSWGGWGQASDPEAHSRTCDWQSGEGHYSIWIGEGGSAVIDGVTIEGYINLSDCDMQGYHGTGNGIRG
jgi:RHS repeat-associated protein